MATHSVFWPRDFHGLVHGVAKSQTPLSDFHFHQLNAHESEQPSGDSAGQGSLACCSPRGLKELDTTE